MSTSDVWQRLAEPASTDLVDARLQLHWAAQLVSALGTTLLLPAADESHTSLEWLAEPGLLAGHSTSDAPRCRAALRPIDLTLSVLDQRNALIAERPLQGLTVSQGLVWLEQEIAAFTKRSLPQPLKRPELALPDHPVGRGAVFCDGNGAALAELGRWYANADAVLRSLAQRMPSASPVRCWPHHFDIATLVRVGSEGEPLRTIGIGMSPGDTTYHQPYWYVTPWPYPKHAPRPTLEGGGEWHDSGWFGAVLTGPTLVHAGSAEAQADHVRAFLRSALEACQVPLDIPTPALANW